VNLGALRLCSQESVIDAKRWLVFIGHSDERINASRI
jgi:hypothetical protein